MAQWLFLLNVMSCQVCFRTAFLDRCFLIFSLMTFFLMFKTHVSLFADDCKLFKSFSPSHRFQSNLKHIEIHCQKMQLLTPVNKCQEMVGK